MLECKSILSDEEKDYLVSFAVKGIPEGLRGRVRNFSS